MNITIPTDVAESIIIKGFDQVREMERQRILSLITEHAQRYSTGSQGRIALETLALGIRERG